MFDLIDECGVDLKLMGYKVSSHKKGEIIEGALNVDNPLLSKKLGLKQGCYKIFNCPNLYENSVDCGVFLSELIKKTVIEFFKILKTSPQENVLISCLGNPDVEADTLGKVVFDRIEINPLNKDNHIYKFCPNIFFSTGIETPVLVKLFARQVKAKCVIIIDSLSTKNLSRLGTSFQLTTVGMTPGSGVNRFGKEINKSFLNIPCLSIGVPFMIWSNDISGQKPTEKNKITGQENNKLLSLKDISQNINYAGEIIASALNEVLQ